MTDTKKILDEIAVVRRFLAATEEMNSWDWQRLLVDHPDSETAKRDATVVEHQLPAARKALEAIEHKTCTHALCRSPRAGVYAKVEAHIVNPPATETLDNIRSAAAGATDRELDASKIHFVATAIASVESIAAIDAELARRKGTQG